MMLSREEVIEKLKTSFPPFECRAELQDHDSKFGFALLDKSGNIIYEKNKIPFTIYKELSQGALDQIIAFTKQRLAAAQSKKKATAEG